MTTTRDEIVAGVREVAAAHLTLDGDLTPDARLVEDVGLDSLALLTLAFEVENHFDIILDPEDELNIRTVDDLIDSIARHLDDATTMVSEP
jgi:acyl carrier protein